MKLFALISLCSLTLFATASLSADELKGKAVYSCPFVDDLPYGVVAWEQSELVRTPGNSRFVDYASGSADTLVLDATLERDVSKEADANPRKTTFWTAWNERGWAIYVKAEEPLVGPLLDTLVDPKSPGRSEMYEMFFTPGLHEVPYYQMMIYPYTEKVSFVDWGMEHRFYRSLEPYVKVESLPLKDGVGTFVFVPWEALYDRLPLEGGSWRFSFIRWMPFAKAGGVTSGGQVHETGRSGIVRFQAPAPEQKVRLERRILRSAWFAFRAEASAAAAKWSDTKVGDPAFYESILKPEIEKQTASGTALGDPDEWRDEAIAQAWELKGDWFEFRYRVSELRTEYLLDRLFDPN